MTSGHGLRNGRKKADLKDKSMDNTYCISSSTPPGKFFNSQNTYSIRISKSIGIPQTASQTQTQFFQDQLLIRSKASVTKSCASISGEISSLNILSDSNRLAECFAYRTQQDVNAYQMSGLYDSMSAQKIQLNNTISSLPPKFFKNSFELQTLDLPYGLVSIGEEAFMNAGNLSHVYFPTTIKEIGGNAFKNCPKSIIVEVLYTDQDSSQDIEDAVNLIQSVFYGSSSSSSSTFSAGQPRIEQILFGEQQSEGYTHDYQAVSQDIIDEDVTYSGTCHYTLGLQSDAAFSIPSWFSSLVQAFGRMFYTLSGILEFIILTISKVEYEIIKTTIQSFSDQLQNILDTFPRSLSKIPFYTCSERFESLLYIIKVQGTIGDEFAACCSNIQKLSKQLEDNHLGLLQFAISFKEEHPSTYVYLKDLFNDMFDFMNSLESCPMIMIKDLETEGNGTANGNVNVYKCKCDQTDESDEYGCHTDTQHVMVVEGTATNQIRKSINQPIQNYIKNKDIQTIFTIMKECVSEVQTWKLEVNDKIEDILKSKYDSINSSLTRCNFHEVEECNYKYIPDITVIDSTLIDLEVADSIAASAKQMEEDFAAYKQKMKELKDKIKE